MKKTILLLLSILLVLVIIYLVFIRGARSTTIPVVSDIFNQSTKISVKKTWSRSYKGLLPCADCAGIMTKLTLNFSPDTGGTYTTDSEYLGKDKPLTETETGTWSFKGDSSTGLITLTDNRDSRVYHAKIDTELKKVTYVDENNNLFESSFPYELAEIIEQK
jgi:uncharacterized lipoprotein NlpE involved in copper resistance